MLETAKIAFRVDASPRLGVGHMMRCLTLADEVAKRGGVAAFLTGSHEANMRDLIDRSGHQVCEIDTNVLVSGLNTSAAQNAEPSKQVEAIDALKSNAFLAEFRPDWVVVDHYYLTGHWQRAVRGESRMLMSIEDVPGRYLSSNLILNQNLDWQEKDFNNSIDGTARYLLGPEYSLLRPEFAAARSAAKEYRVRRAGLRVLISLGGTDYANATKAVLESIASGNFPGEIEFRVVLGREAPWLDSIERLVGTMKQKVGLVVSPEDMGDLMAGYDVAIGAAGSTAWERCCLGLPSLLVVVADNQEMIAHSLQKRGAALVLDAYGTEGFSAQLHQALLQCFDDRVFLSKMSSAAARITDGLGVKRVVAAMADLQESRQ